MNEDWLALRAIYGSDFDEDNSGSSRSHDDDRRIRLEESTVWVPSPSRLTNGDSDSAKTGDAITSRRRQRGYLCGTVYMTLSTSRVAFARRVNDMGGYRYFMLERSPVLKLDFFYLSVADGDGTNEDDNDMNVTDENDDDKRINDDDGTSGPSFLRLAWEYYPIEWPALDREPFRSCLAKKAAAILKQDAMAFAVCEFLEHEALLSYTGSSSDDNNNNRSAVWKTFVGDDFKSSNYSDYLLVILPPEMDLMYKPTVGILLYPKKEAAVIERVTGGNRTKQHDTYSGKGKNGSGTLDDGIGNIYTYVSEDATTSTLDRGRVAADKKIAGATDIGNSQTVTGNVTLTMQFAHHALIRVWKHLYTTSCPVCLEDEMPYSEGVVLPRCQHYCCSDCFVTYLRYKVRDLNQFRTNPFCCPVDTCQQELPIVGFCKRYLSKEDMEAVRAWYHDLKHPPAWSLDRCLATKACGALGSMRRKYGGCVNLNKNQRNGQDRGRPSSSSAPPSMPASLQHLIYCQECNKTWCELCLKRVNEDDEVDYDTRHRQEVCQPSIPLKLCRRYRAASPELQQQCQERFPWIVSYSLFCQHDGAALDYIYRNGQRCPNCQTGVERIEGCFHMKCPTCATHFCYECGTELFPPYYGTHHCWEEQPRDHETQQAMDADEQMAMALHMAGEGYNIFHDLR